MLSSTKLTLEARTTSVRLGSLLGAYERVVDRLGPDEAFLLETLAGPARDRRHSVLGLGRILEVSVLDTRVKWHGRDALVRAMARTLRDIGIDDAAVDGHGIGAAHLSHPQDAWDVVRGVLTLLGGHDGPGGGPLCLAFFGYDAARRIEKLPALLDRTEAPPDITIVAHQAHVRVPVGSDLGELTVWEAPGCSADNLQQVLQALDTSGASAPPSALPPAPTPVEVHDEMTSATFADLVGRCHEHIAAGDVYQVQIGHEIAVRSALDPVDAYRRLRHRNPAPYMSLARWQGRWVIGSSPELFVRLDGETILMRPVAGTAPSCGGAESAAAALHGSEKEMAEHLMLVDLCRNDIGRVCAPGSLRLVDTAVVERFSHVLHMVSTVAGARPASTDAIDVVTALFPAGTMTGAPKVRAMEIIESLEASPRGLYAGAIGTLSPDGDVDLALGIRMLTLEGGVYRMRASAGVVADSTPEQEWSETLAKVSGPFWAVTGQEIFR